MNSISKNTFGLTQRDMNTLVSILQKHNTIKDVVIFGSRAKGNYKTGSDIDLVIMNKDVSNTELIQLKNDFEESSLPYFVDVLNYHSIQTPDLINHISRVGEQLYKQ